MSKAAAILECPKCKAAREYIEEMIADHCGKNAGRSFCEYYGCGTLLEIAEMLK